MSDAQIVSVEDEQLGIGRVPEAFGEARPPVVGSVNGVTISTARMPKKSNLLLLMGFSLATL